jgi:hypothetical protein
MVRALVTAGALFFVAYVLEIGVEVWVVNHPDPADSNTNWQPVPPVTHIRHYVLPLGGFALFAMLVLSRALPAMGDAFSIVEARGPMAEPFRYAFRALAWTAAAIAVFQIAIWLQCRLFGFFLPP